MHLSNVSSGHGFHVPIAFITVSENVSHFASLLLLHSLSQGTGSNQNTEKAQEPPRDIWRMPNMADKWRRSCARLRAPSLSRPWSYEAVHTRLCLLSLWHGKTTNTRDEKEREKERKKKERGEARVGGWKTDGKVERSKVADRQIP